MTWSWRNCHHSGLFLADKRVVLYFYSLVPNNMEAVIAEAESGKHHGIMVPRPTATDRRKVVEAKKIEEDGQKFGNLWRFYCLWFSKYNKKNEKVSKLSSKLPV